MKLEEFKAFIQEVIKPDVTDRDINFAYNLSMMTSPDELYKTRHLEMNFCEFLEALARIAEIIALPPAGIKNSGNGGGGGIGIIGGASTSGSTAAAGGGGEEENWNSNKC